MDNKPPVPAEWKSNPRPVSALEYCHILQRANRDAGRDVTAGDIYTIQNKLMEELRLPKIRVLQMLNRLHEANNVGKPTIEISTEDASIILGLATHLIDL